MQLEIESLFSVKDKVALVTGGGSGLGLMISTALVKNGCRVYIASRKYNEIQKVAETLNEMGIGKCIAIEGSLGSKADAYALANKFKHMESKLNILINNSGMSWGNRLEDFDEKNGWDRLFSLNVKTVFYLTAALIPELEKAANGNIDPARVINISSVASTVAVAETPLSVQGAATWSYNASKAAVNQLTRTLASTLAPKFITVNAVAPGFFPSKMTAFGLKENKSQLLSAQPLGRVGIPEDISAIILFLASKGSSHITGAVIPLDGGQSLSLSAHSRL